jgi:hypothetical protein
MSEDGQEMRTKEQQMKDKELENRKREIIKLINEGYIKNIRLLNIITGGLFTDKEVGTESEDYDTLVTTQIPYNKDSILDILDSIIIHAKEKKCQEDKFCTISFKKYKNKKKIQKKSGVQKKKSLRKSSTKKSLSKTKKSLKKSKKSLKKSLKKL